MTGAFDVELDFGDFCGEEGEAVYDRIAGDDDSMVVEVEYDISHGEMDFVVRAGDEDITDALEPKTIDRIFKMLNQY